MQRHRSPLRPLALIAPVLVLVLALAACGPVKEPQKPPIDPDIARAQLLVDQQDYLGAAELYRALSARNTGASGYDYLLAGADAALAGGDINGAMAMLGQALQAPLSARQALLARLIQAELMMAQRRPDQALELLLGNPPDPQQPLDLRQRYQRALADAYRKIGNLLESARALQGLDDLQTDPAQRLETQTEILRSLALLNELVLTNLQPSPPGVQGGWMELALLVKQHGDDPQALQPLIEQWRARFPNHPALPELLTNYQERLKSQIQRAAHVAILLPQSGPYAAVAQALRDGLMISYYQLPAEKRPLLRFYDSTDTNATWPLYTQAVAEGAELVIGPLQKESVAQLARAGELPAPVLALNQVSTDSIPPLNLFMFALSPEDEARQAAERIWLDGLRRPALLVPEGDWGNRIANAFEDRWRTLSGSSADARRYDPSGSDYTAAITSLLHLDRSEARHQELQRWLGQRLEFEPRRRQDVDAVFLAAQPRQAQSFPPQLQFHHAADLPVYATSHAWTGELNPQQLADMSGMMLADVPLLVSGNDRERLAQDIPGINGPLFRLYAMGMDAFNLVPHLRRLQSSTFESLDGQSGNLFMDAENRILRQTVWLKLAEPPQILGYAARLDLQNYGIGGAAPTEPETGSEPATETAEPASPTS